MVQNVGLSNNERGYGEIGSREVDAYLLDYDNFTNVLPTILINITHSVFHMNDGINHASGKAYEKP